MFEAVLELLLIILQLLDLLEVSFDLHFNDRLLADQGILLVNNE